MRLIWLKSDYIIPPDHGGKIRTYNLLRQLHKLCRVTYVSLKNSTAPNDEPEMKECASEVVTFYRPDEIKSGMAFHARVLAHCLSSVPYTVAKYRSPEMIGLLNEYATQSEDAVVVCDFLDMAQNVTPAMPFPRVLFQHNVETMIWRRHFETERHPLKRAYFGFESRRMAAYEKKTCETFDMVLTVSQEDKRILAEEFKVTRPIGVVETGVDTEYFAPRHDITPIPGRLVFTGSMDWLPNIDAAKHFVAETYPLIKRSHPGVTLDVVGRRPGAEIRALAEGDPTIRVTGDVPDVRPYLAAADLAIVPLRIGGGTRIKIYEAMAMKRPVVSTTVGAEGLPITDGEHLVLADGPRAFAAAVGRMLDSPQDRDRLAHNGHRLVVEKYRWEHVAGKFHDVCRSLLEQKSRRVGGM